MTEKKSISIIEEALLDVKNIQSALNEHTKEILRSVAREEIDSVVKESLLKEDDFEVEDLDSTDNAETDLGGEADAATADVNADLGGEESIDGLDSIEGSEEVSPEIGAEDGMDALALDTEPMDMTTSSDDDIISLYKKLSGEDEIEIIGDEMHLNISEPGQYIVKVNDTPVANSTEEIPTDLTPVDGEETTDGDDTDFEIEMGGDDESSSEEIPTDLTPVDGEEEGGEEETEEPEELTEAIPVGLAQSKRLPGKADIGQPRGAGAEKIDESVSKKLVLETQKKYNALLTEANKIKTENEHFRKALKVFRTQLLETVVFNSNLTYTTRLFMEHSTTKTEKQNIIKRFDSEVSNLVESKKLYKTISNELNSRKPINESVENKIIKEVTTGASKQLNESTAYVDPSTKRIIDLMKRIEKK